MWSLVVLYTYIRSYTQNNGSVASIQTKQQSVGDLAVVDAFNKQTFITL